MNKAGQVKSNQVSSASAFALTEHDLAWLAASYITPELANEAGIYRVDHWTGVGEVGAHPKLGESYAGLIFPYYHPVTGLERERVLRRDVPDREPQSDGTWKEKKKYCGPPGRTNMFYFPPGVTEAMRQNPKLRIVFVEGEKKTLALWRIAREAGEDGQPAFLVIGLRGVWGWRGITGKASDEDGNRISLHGSINDFDYFTWMGREVTLFYDSNIHSKNPRTRDSVRGARKGLADHLHYILEANVFFAEMTREQFEWGLNGPDNLAVTNGPDAVLQLLDETTEAFKIKTYQPREKLSPEGREKRADVLRQAAMQNAEFLAADVIGSTAAKNLARLWAEAGLSSESRDLLFTLESMAMGCDELEFYYAELYPLLFKLKGNEFEQTATGGQKLKSSPRKRLRDRFEKLEAEQKQCGITFAYLIEGHKEGGNNVPSRVALSSRGYIGQVMIMAEEDPLYSRGKKAARNRAFATFVREKSGIAYVAKPGKRRNRNKQIVDGWKRFEGNLKANIKRMRERGDSEESIWLTMAEFMPLEFLAFVTAKKGDLKTAIGSTDSANDSARSPKTCKEGQLKPASDPVAIEIWERLVERSQGKRLPGAKVIQ